MLHQCLDEAMGGMRVNKLKVSLDRSLFDRPDAWKLDRQAVLDGGGTTTEGTNVWLRGSLDTFSPQKALMDSVA